MFAGEHEKFQIGGKVDHFDGYENRALHADFGAQFDYYGELGETEVDVEMIASDVCTGFAADFVAGKKNGSHVM